MGQGWSEELELFKGCTPYGTQLSGWQQLWDRLLPWRQPEKLPGIYDQVLNTLCITSYRNQTELMHLGDRPNVREIMAPPGEFAFFDISEAQIREMEKLVDDGLVRAIGVSNFSAAQCEALCKVARIPPACNQVESHPFFAQTELLAACRKLGIVMTAVTLRESNSQPSNPHHRAAHPRGSED